MSSKPNVTAFVYDRKGNLLSVGRNSYVKTHPLQARAAAKVNQENRIYLHAEIAALVKVKEWKDAFRISIFRYGANGTPLSAAPCPICEYVIKQTGIKRIEHT